MGLKLLLAVVTVIAGVAVYHYATRSRQMSPGSVAAMIGADFCDSSDFYVQNKLDGSKATIYDCTTGAKMRCVTVEHRIASDATATVRFLFADTLGTRKPSCIGG